MKSMFRAILVISLTILPVSVVGQALPKPQEKESAGQTASNSLRGKHGIELGLGLLGGVTSTVEVSAGDVRTKGETDGLFGSIGYTYWLENDWGITFSAGVSDVDATVSTNDLRTFAESATIVPLLFGVKYQPSGLLNRDSVRPFVSASVGPYLGFSSDVRTGVVTIVEDHSEAALGSRLTAGVDLFPAKWFKVGFGGGYNLVTDFENRIGSEKNFSGPEFSLSFGVVFGKGKK